MAKRFERIVEFFCDGDRCPLWLRKIVRTEWLGILNSGREEQGC